MRDRGNINGPRLWWHGQGRRGCANGENNRIVDTSKVAVVKVEGVTPPERIARDTGADSERTGVDVMSELGLT
jgi:hypothetical protein